jgi:uncharacterized membrane protein YeiH
MQTIVNIFEIIGIVSFSAAGAMIAIDKEMDIFGVVLSAIITCFGGGMLRDIFIGNTHPVFFTLPYPGPILQAGIWDKHFPR